MGKIIAVFNQKGGVAKTATVNSLAFELNARGKKVLMIDADQQENLSISVGILPRQLKHTIFELLKAEIECVPYKKDLSEYIMHTDYGVDIIPGSVQMAGMDEMLFSLMEIESPLDKFLKDYKLDYALQHKAEDAELDEYIEWFAKLQDGYMNARDEFMKELQNHDFLERKDGDLIIKKILSLVKQQYDYVIIDCPPALSAITKNILNAANSILVPMTLETFSASGLTHLVNSVDAIRARKNPGLKFSGLLCTMVENRIVSKELKAEIDVYKQFMYIYKTEIPRSADVNKAFAEMVPIMEYNEESTARIAYSNFCDEFLEREG